MGAALVGNNFLSTTSCLFHGNFMSHEKKSDLPWPEKTLLDGFRENLAAFPARFCGHVWAGFVEPAKPENLVDSEKQRPCFASGNADDELKWTENSLCTILITLWSVLFFLKVR